MPPFDSRRLNACFRPLALALLAWCAAAPALAAPPVTWALAPTRIRVYLSAEASPEWPAARRAELARELSSRSQSLAGALWQLDVVESSKEMAAAVRAGLDRAASSAAITKAIESLVLAPEGPNKEVFDKFVLVHLGSTPAGEQVQAREWDVYTGTWGPTLTRRAPPGGLGHAAFGALRAACGTLARLELGSSSAPASPAAAPGTAPAAGAPAPKPVSEAGVGRVFLRVRGGDLTPRDSSLSPAQVGDVLRVVRRSAGSAGKVASSQEVPWTYLMVEKVTGAQATCRVYSHFRDPLGQTLVPREEWVAVGVGGTGQPTTLRVAAAAAPGAPVAGGSGLPVTGLEVLAYAPTGGKAVSLGRTSRDGTLEIPAAESPMRVLLLKRGPDLVGRYPLVTGWPASVEVTLSGDDTRLAVATSVAAIELRLLELVTRREIELARLRARVKEKRKSEAEELLKGFQEFDARRAELEKWIQDERNRMTAADPETQQHVNQVYAALSTAVAKHLDPGAVQQLATELVAGTAPPPEGTPAPEQPPLGGNAGPRPELTSQDPTALSGLTAAGAALQIRLLKGVYYETLVFPIRMDEPKFAQAIPHFKALKNIQCVFFVDATFNDASLASLKDLPGLKAAYFGNCSISDAGVAHLAGITSLEYLSLNRSKALTDAGLVHLKGLTRLAAIDLSETAVTTTGLAHLTALPELKSIELWKTPVDDTGLAALGSLTKLECLDLSETRVTNTGLSTLARFPSLKELHLRQLPLNDAALVNLKGLTNLEKLRLDGCQITDAGLSNLAGLAKLQFLALDATPVSDAGLAHLAGLVKMQFLVLDGTRITDAGFAQLKGMTGLVGLSLTGTKVGDPSIPIIKGFANLQSLTITGAGITAAGIADLEKAMPQLQISGKP